MQASGTWSLKHLEASPEHVSAMLCVALSEALGCLLPHPVAAVSHRWRYALSAGTGDGTLWNHTIGLGVCGDWLLGPRVECAWLSGRMTAQRCIDFDPLAKSSDTETTGSLETGLLPS